MTPYDSSSFIKTNKHIPQNPPIKKDNKSYHYNVTRCKYAEMYKERYGTDIEDIVILIVTEQGLNQVFHKKKQDYIPKLKEAIQDFNGNNNT